MLRSRWNLRRLRRCLVLGLLLANQIRKHACSVWVNQNGSNPLKLLGVNSGKVRQLLKHTSTTTLLVETSNVCVDFESGHSESSGACESWPGVKSTRSDSRYQSVNVCTVGQVVLFGCTIRPTQNELVFLNDVECGSRLHMRNPKKEKTKKARLPTRQPGKSGVRGCQHHFRQNQFLSHTQCDFKRLARSSV